MTISAVNEFTVNKQNPFCSFAGGRLFGAPGVLFSGMSDPNNYEVIDNQGNTNSQPVTRTFTVSDMKAGSEVRMYTDDGNRTELSSSLSPSPGIEASTSFVSGVDDVTLVGGGTGYFVGDILTLTGGTGTAIQLTVATVSGTTITSVTLTTGGLYTATPINSNHTNGGEGGGSGTNATFTFEYTATPFSFSYLYNSEPFNGSDVDVYIQVMHLNHPYIRLATTLTDADQNIPVQQGPDRVYFNP